MRKRNRIVLFLVLPLVVFMWFIGWSLDWISSREAAQPKKTQDQNENEPPLIALMPEKKYAT
jgi:hypothetical protein